MRDRLIRCPGIPDRLRKHSVPANVSVSGHRNTRRFRGHRLWGAPLEPKRKYKIYELTRPVSAVEMALSVLLTDSDLCRIPTEETDDPSWEVTQSYHDQEKVFPASEEDCTI